MGLKYSADTVRTWQNHFKRMDRWKVRVIEAASSYEDTDFHDVFDFVLAYFVWCHSMREWLINSKAIDKNKLDTELAKYEEWPLCRDIANRSRHFELRMNPKDKDWSIGREYDIFSKMSGQKMRHVLFLVSDDEKYDVVELVGRTQRMWRDIVEGLN